MQTFLLAIIAILFVVLALVFYRLHKRGQTRQLDREALAMTPICGSTLTGHWRARQETNNGYVSWGVQLEQHGMAISGSMQCKFAGAHPLTIRGILDDGNLTATWSRPYKYCMGSGVVHLTISPDGNTLTGTTRWYNAENPDGIVDDWCWERS